MYLTTVQVVVFAAIASVAFYSWTTRNDRDYLWLSLISAAGLLLKIWDYVSINVLEFPLLARSICDGLSVLVWCGLILLVCKIMFSERKK
jgi:hypothetical protein